MFLLCLIAAFSHCSCSSWGIECAVWCNKVLLEAKSLISNLLTPILQFLIWNADVNWIKEKTFHLEKFSQKLFKINIFFFSLFKKDETLIVLWSPVAFEPLNKKSKGRILELSGLYGRYLLHGKFPSDSVHMDYPLKCFHQFCLSAFDWNEPTPWMLLNL